MGRNRRRCRAAGSAAALPRRPRVRRAGGPSAPRTHAADPRGRRLERARPRGQALAARRGTGRPRPHRLGRRARRRRPWPVLALWWDADHAGYTLASGFRRPVGYVWLTDGTPAGEDEAMRTFAVRLGLDPVLDLQSLDQLTKPDPEADARARLRGVLAILTRAGVALPTGLSPGSPPTASGRSPASSPTPGRLSGRAGGKRSARNSTPSTAAASAPGCPGPAPQGTRRRPDPDRGGPPAHGLGPTTP